MVSKRLMLMAAFTAAVAQAQPTTPAKGGDPAFRMQCASGSVRFLPKGNAAVGSLKFTVQADPGAQQVSVDGGEKRAAKIDKFEVSFRTSEGPVMSISRSMKKFRLVVPIKDSPADDSRQYLMYEGDCQVV